MKALQAQSVRSTEAPPTRPAPSWVIFKVISSGVVLEITLVMAAGDDDDDGLASLQPVFKLLVMNQSEPRTQRQCLC